MLDINVIRNNPDLVKKAVADKKEKADIDRILELDAAWRAKVAELEEKQALRNSVSKEIAEAKKDGADASEKIALMKQVSADIKNLEVEVREVRETVDQELLWVPNVPDEDVPVGVDENDNPVIKEWGDRKEFSFSPCAHWDIGENLDIIDFKRGVKLSGSGFFALKGKGARLERALINFMLDLHTKEHGYTEIQPPILVNRASMEGSGQIPKMEDQMYHCGVDDLFLVPTAEVPLTNIRGGEILEEEELPHYITAYTPCFRREAGAAGKDTRGIIRVHQFDKVELLKLVTPETSADELEKLLANAEKVLQILDIPYRIITLCTGDMSFASAKTYDIELWAPGIQRYLEVSSCSNFRDFQARRCNIRYRKDGKKIEYVHTLNGSGVALPRLMIAILENYQQEDGSVSIPEALVPYTGFDTID